MRATCLDDFHRHVATHEHGPPVVYNLLQGERGDAHEKWTLEKILATDGGGDVHVGVHHGRNPCFFDFKSSAMELAQSAVTRQMSLRDLACRIADTCPEGKNGYDLLSGTDTHMFIRETGGVVSRWSKMWHDCEGMIRRDLGSSTLERVGFWMSGKGMSSQMHWDVNGHHNLNYQVFGAKSVIMFDPQDTPFLYCMPARLWHLSRIDPRPGHYSLQTHPLFAHATPLQFDLVRGDVLYIPAGWYHHFTHQGDYNVNVTAWFTSARSGRKWTWDKFWVANPFEAWMFVGKFVFALIFVLPWVLLWGKVVKR